MKLLTLARDLKRRKARERNQRFIVEGIRSIEELLRSGIPVLGVLAGPQPANASRAADLIAQLEARDIPVAHVSADEFDSATETDAPQGLMAIADIPQPALGDVSFEAGRPIVILDAVQDPGNVGTIIRTAAAFGASAIIAAPGTVDLWNPKVVRSSMGASFHLAVLSAEWEQLDQLHQEQGVLMWGADASGAPIGSIDVPRKLALVVGNEGNGLSPDGRQRCDALVSLPIETAVESLNVAVATGILLYQLRM